MRNRLDSYSGLIVGGQRLAIKQVSDDTRSFDSAQCECGSFLTFSTNHFGYVLESCPTCKYSRPMQPAQTRSLEELAEYALEAPEPKEVFRARGQCIECSAEIIGTGTRAPKRCHDCKRTRQLAHQREWSRKRREAA